MQIRIKDTPPGEAPEQIRHAWIGLMLPLLPGASGRCRGVGFGVLSGPKNRWVARFAVWLGFGKRQVGYAVASKVAIDLLAVQAPEAANWWRTNVPHLYQPERHFIFAAECCEEIPSPAA